MSCSEHTPVSLLFQRLSFTFAQVSNSLQWALFFREFLCKKSYIEGYEGKYQSALGLYPDPKERTW